MQNSIGYKMWFNTFGYLGLVWKLECGYGVGWEKVIEDS